ncbi:MAG: hypothetical protein OXC01_20115 [Immundisolibacterales bacterium]|nr:hypothetical protein [Immundisolibacterales bacterium]
MTWEVLRFSLWTIGAVGAASAVGLAGCGFVPGLDPWLDTRSCLTIGFIAGKFLG